MLSIRNLCQGNIGRFFPRIGGANIFYALAFSAPIVGSVAPLQMWMLVLIGGSILFFRTAVTPWQSNEKPSLFAVIFVGFLFWGLFSTFWATDPLHSVEMVGRLLVLGLALASLLRSAQSLTLSEQQHFMKCLCYGGVVALVLTLLGILAITIYTVWIQAEQMADHKLSVFNRTASVLVLFVWVISVALSVHFGRSAAIGFFILSMVSVALLAPSAPILALLIGGVVFAAAYVSPALGKSMLAGGFLLSILIVPLMGNIAPLAKDFLAQNIDSPHTSVHRIAIWDFAAEHIMRRPLAGWGLNASRDFPGGDEEIFLFPKGMYRYVTLRMDLPGDRLPEAVTFALVIGIMQNHHQMKATSLYFHLVKVLRDSDH